MKNTSDHTKNTNNQNQTSPKSTSSEKEDTYWELLKKSESRKKSLLKI